MTNLSDDAKRQLIEGYLAQFAIDAFGHTLNKQTALTHNDISAVYKADLALYNIQVATITYQRELDIINGLDPGPIVLPDPPVNPVSPEGSQGPLSSQPE